MSPHSLRHLSTPARGNRALFVFTAFLGAVAMFGLFKLTQHLVPANAIEAAIPSSLPPLVSLPPSPERVSASLPANVEQTSISAAAQQTPVGSLRASASALSSAAVSAPTQASSRPSVAPSGLDGQVTTILAGLPAGATALFQDLNLASHAERNGSAAMVAASVIKLPIAVEVLRQENAGTLSATAAFTVKSSDVVGGTGVLQGQVGRTLTLPQLVDTTITYSDNVGANLLLGAVGGMDTVNRTLSSLGYSETRVRRLLMDMQTEQRGIENMASAAEISDMLAKAYRGQLVNAAVSQDVMRVLKLRGQQTDPALDFMGRQLLPRPTLAHINGELNGIRNDAGVVDTGKHAYVLSVFVHAPGREAEAERAIADASAAVYKLELSG